EAELSEALAAGVDRVLIDNQPPETVARWCAIARSVARPPFLEASGNMRLDTVRAYALAGVDAVSVGALTHSVRAADVSLELFPDWPRKRRTSSSAARAWPAAPRPCPRRAAAPPSRS